MKKYLFLINPAAGSGKAADVWRLLQTLLAKENVDYDFCFSKHPGHPRAIANDTGKQRKYGCLVVVGGDGTLHEVIDGLYQQAKQEKMMVAYIPAGTGNDFARGYGISTDPRIALQQVLKNDRPRKINIGCFQELNSGKHGVFLNNIGIGFDAAIVHATNHSRLKSFLNHHHLGTLSYIAKAIHVFFTQPTFQTVIKDRTGVVTLSRTFLLITSNHPYIGGGVVLAPDAKVDHHELELVVVEKRNWWSLLAAMLMFAGGRLIYSRQARVIRSRKLEYQIGSPQDCQLDGEEPGKMPYHLRLTCGSYPFWEKPL